MKKIMLAVVWLRLLETLIKFGEKDMLMNARCKVGFRNFVVLKSMLKMRQVMDISLLLKMRN